MSLLAPSRAFILFCLILVCAGMDARAGMTNYAEPGQTDFDTALLTLNPYGTWSKIDGVWAYTPFDHLAPYTNGRWLYTEYGWYWKGNAPHSWATEHYGYWKRGADHVWSWYPGPYWLPETVEIRATTTHIGWRSAAVDQDGNFIEKPEDRWAKTDEWSFVTLAQFANPITPKVIAKPDQAASLLEDSTESTHTYVTYREIDRPGPHPADFVSLCRDGGMLAPLTLQDRLALQKAPPLPIIPGYTPGTTLTDTNINVAPQPPPAPAPSSTPPPAPSGLASSTPAPSAAAPAPAPPPVRRVKYWVTKCLPTYWASPPPDATDGDLYIYRPAFYQDQDGIGRRVAIWLDPDLLKRTKQSLSSLLSSGGGATAPAQPATPAAPVTPAVPAGSSETAKPYNPFRGAYGETYHGSASSGSNTSTKGSGATNAASSSGGLIPPPITTNAAPANTP